MRESDRGSVFEKWRHDLYTNGKTRWRSSDRCDSRREKDNTDNTGPDTQVSMGSCRPISVQCMRKQARQTVNQLFERFTWIIDQRARDVKIKSLESFIISTTYPLTNMIFYNMANLHAAEGYSALLHTSCIQMASFNSQNP